MKTVACLLLAVGLLFTTTPASAYHDGRHSLRWRTMHAAERLCSQRRPTACITYAAVKYRVSGPLMRSIARCESRFRPWARNPSGASGLFQFMPSTFRGTRYGRHSIWSARWNSLAAAWMLDRGRRNEWVC